MKSGGENQQEKKRGKPIPLNGKRSSLSLAAREKKGTHGPAVEGKGGTSFEGGERKPFSFFLLRWEVFELSRNPSISTS